MRKLSFLFIPLLASCAGGWHDEDKTEYLQQCKAEAQGMYESPTQADKYCQCNLDVVMKHYPTMEEVVFNKDSTAVTNALKDCSVKARE